MYAILKRVAGFSAILLHIIPPILTVVPFGVLDAPRWVLYAVAFLFALIPSLSVFLYPVYAYAFIVAIRTPATPFKIFFYICFVIMAIMFLSDLLNILRKRV